MTDEALTLKGIWNDSPLGRDAIRQILSAPTLKIAFAEPIPGTIETTLAHIAGMILKLSVWRQKATKTEWESVRRNFVGLVKALNKIGFVIDKPPYPPEDWAEEMVRWLGKGPSKAEKGPPKIELDSFAFPVLLAFYAVVYGESPVATALGNTERFLTEFFDRMRDVTTRSEWYEKDSVLSRPDPAKGIRAAADDRVRGRIREWRERVDANAMRIMMDDVANAIRAGTPS